MKAKVKAAASQIPVIPFLLSELMPCFSSEEKTIAVMVSPEAPEFSLGRFEEPHGPRATRSVDGERSKVARGVEADEVTVFW